MPAPWISASGTLYLSASSIPVLGTVMFLRQGTTWDVFNSQTLNTFPGHAIGICISQGPVVPGTPISVQTFGIVPPDWYLAGGGNAGPIVANGSGGIGRGTFGQIIGFVDSSGFLTLTGNIIGSGGGGTGPVVGNVAGYALDPSPLSNGQIWSYNSTSQTLVPTTVTSQLGAYGADLAGSANSKQYVASISGPSGLGGPVSVGANSLYSAVDLLSTLGTSTGRWSTMYTQTVLGGTHASAGAGNNSVFQAENANGSANAGGDAIIAPGVSGSAARSGFTRFTQGGPTTTVGIIGNVPTLPNGALWLSTTAGMATPTSINYAIYTDGTNVGMNAIGVTGYNYFSSGGTLFGAVKSNSPGASLWLNGPPTTTNYAIQTDGTSLWHNTVSTKGYHYFLEAGVTIGAIGPVAGGQGGIWLFGAAGGTAGAANQILLTDASTYSALNAPTTTGSAYLGAGGSIFASVNSAGIGGYSGAGSTPATASLNLQTTQIPITTGTYTLTVAQAACPSLQFYSTLTGNVTVVMPQSRSFFWADTTSVSYNGHQVTFAYATTSKVYGTAAIGVYQLAGNALDHLYGFPGL
jgi:hypothetical protein